MDSINTTLLNKLMEQADVEMTHMPMKNEFDFYTLVSTGNAEGLEKRGFSLMDKGLGTLSENKRRNILYHFIISISLITRMCIERGMPSETAYTLSDLYIQKADKEDTPEEINRLHRKMVYDYTDRMKKLERTRNYSKHVLGILEYVNDHLGKNLSVSSLAEEFNLNKSYLCSLFKKETGITIGSYIESKKNKLAMEYLANTNIPYIDISNALGYKSYSYFIHSFKKMNGSTPAKFRKDNYGKYL